MISDARLTEPKKVRVGVGSYVSALKATTTLFLRRIGVLISAFALLGCAANPIEPPIGLPAQPNLIPINQFQWDQVPPELQDIWLTNDLELKKWGRKLEARIKAHDESL
jgi:hypothetical protein